MQCAATVTIAITALSSYNCQGHYRVAKTHRMAAVTRARTALHISALHSAVIASVTAIVTERAISI